MKTRMKSRNVFVIGGALIVFLSILVYRQASKHVAAIPVVSPASYGEIVATELAGGAGSDTSFLGFVLGMPEREARSYFSDLEKSRRLGGDMVWDLGYARVGGNQYTLQLNDTTSCDCALSAEYFEDRLYFLTLLIFKCQTGEIMDFLKRMYGNPDVKVGDGTFWIEGNKELEFRTIGGVDALEFRDLRLKKKHLELNKFIDSAETQLKREGAKRTEGDFK